jgi:ABC-type antimicrobial peptide transport system permease subunit
MKKIDFIKMGIKNLWRRKLRTILTVVGVVVGTFSIVIMMSLGIAMNEGYKQQIMEMGSLTKITVNQYNYVYDEKSDMGTSQEKKLDDALVETIKKIPHVKAGQSTNRRSDRRNAPAPGRLRP